MGGQTVGFTFNLDPEMVALSLVLLSAVSAVATVLYGLLLLWPRTGGAIWARHRSFARELAVWTANGPTVTATQIDEINRQFRSLTAYGLLGVGIGWLLGIGSVCALAISATGSLASLLTGGAGIQNALQFQGCALGYMLGFLTGSARATCAPSTTTYGDLRRRRASDYRAGWLSWGLVALSLYSGAPLWLLATTARHVTLTFNDANWTLPTNTTVMVFLAMGILIPITAALCMHWLAESPRVLRGAEPYAARNADDFRRALGINIVLATAWISSGALLQGLANTLTTSQVGQVSITASWLNTGAYLLGFGAFIFGLVLMPLHGRLGGHLTGWRRPVAQPGATAGHAGELAHE